MNIYRTLYTRISLQSYVHTLVKIELINDLPIPYNMIAISMLLETIVEILIRENKPVHRRLVIDLLFFHRIACISFSFIFCVDSCYYCWSRGNKRDSFECFTFQYKHMLKCARPLETIENSISEKGSWKILSGILSHGFRHSNRLINFLLRFL